ncbi:MAG: hypothetical protein ACRD18_07520 [Terriglobia bacterium]
MPQTITQSQPVADLAELLAKAGAQRPQYGRKWDCPACGGSACLSVDEGRGLFNCFHAGCGLKGNTATLRKRLGLASPRLSPIEYRRLRERERRLDERADRLLAAKRERRTEVIDTLARLYRLECGAHGAGPDNPSAWDALADIYAQRQRLEAELLILDNARAQDLERFLITGANGDRETAIENVIMLGGLADARGRFVPLETEGITGQVSGCGESRKEGGSWKPSKTEAES